MPINHLLQNISNSVRNALNSGELELAERLAYALLRLQRERNQKMLDQGFERMRNNVCTVRDERYKRRNYVATAIVSTYNAERFIEGRLADLLGQSLGNRLEILVIDSASPEGEGDIVAEFQKKADNIRYFRTERRESVYQSWNRGVQHATGAFLTNANTDDRLRRDALERLTSSLSDTPAAGVAYADFHITSFANETFENNRSHETTRRPPYSNNALLENCVTGSQPVWRRELHNSLGLFDISYTSAGDYDFFIRAAQKKQCLAIHEILGLVWISTDTFSGKGRLPTLEFYELREKYQGWLTPTEKRTVLNQAEHDSLRSFTSRDTVMLDKIASESAPIAYAIGSCYEEQGNFALAWKYLQKAYYLVPEFTAYRLAKDRLLTANLRSIIADLAQTSEPSDNIDQILTMAISLKMLEWPATATWCYYRALCAAPDSAVALVNFRKMLDNKSLGVW